MDDGVARLEPGLPQVPASAVPAGGPPGRLLRMVSDQRVAFLLVGGLNTVISLIVFAIFSRFLTLWAGDLALLAAQAVAIPIAFLLHRRFVFRVTGHRLRDLGRFTLVNVIPITVNLVVLPILTNGFGWPVLPAQTGFTALWVVCSFFLHRGFSFARPSAGSAPDGSAPDAVHGS